MLNSNQLHDNEAEWREDDRDDIDSIISGYYKEMQKMFEEEELPGSGTRTKVKKVVKNKNDGSLLTGNIKQYNSRPPAK